MSSIAQRLLTLKEQLSAPAVLAGRGLGNEIPFYVFDYEAVHEYTVQNFLPRLIQELGLVVQVVNLYLLVLDYLQDQELLEPCLALEAESGTEALEEALRDVLIVDEILDFMMTQFTIKPQMVFLTGVGAVWPMLRSHTVLNNLHHRIDHIPVVMFYPGVYNGQTLRLFSSFTDDHYYRAFRIAPPK